MKKVLFAVLLSLCGFAWAREKPNPADYTVTVHVSNSFIGEHGEQRVKVLIDGKHYELAATATHWLLALGDYRAKLVKDEHEGTYNSFRIYEFLLPDQKTRQFTVVGQSE